MKESEAPRNRQAGDGVFDRPNLLAQQEAVLCIYDRVSVQSALSVCCAWRGASSLAVTHSLPSVVPRQGDDMHVQTT
jgi:hypothetical protein